MKNTYLITAATLLALPVGSAFADAKFDKMMKDSFQSISLSCLKSFFTQGDLLQAFFLPVCEVAFSLHKGPASPF